MDLSRRELSDLDKAYGVFWDECQSINSECGHSHDAETEKRKVEIRDDDIFGQSISIDDFS